MCAGMCTKWLALSGVPGPRFGSAASQSMGASISAARQKNKKVALEIADKWERTWQQKRGEVQIRRVFSDFHEIVRGEQLTETSTRKFLTAWLARKKIETKPNTWEKYQSVVNQFVRFLGASADDDLLFLTSKQVADFRDELAGRLSSATANLALKILRVAFNQAFRDGFIQASPAAQVTTISRRGERSKRHGFTLPELQRALANASNEWRGLILFGLYTGQRLKDIATLTHQNARAVQKREPCQTHPWGASACARSPGAWAFQPEPFYREQSAKPGRAMHFHASPSVTTTASVFSNREFTGRGSLRPVRN